jgi:predicted PurR-regulated permease PerM
MGLHPSPRGDKDLAMGNTARRAATATLVGLSIVAAALALWKIKAVIALMFLGFVVAAAMRPSVEWLHRAARIPRGLGVLIHYAALLGLIALLLWLIVPRAISQIDQAVGSIPTSSSQLQHQAHQSHGFKREVLLAIQHRLQRLPSVGGLVDPLVSATKTAFEILIGIFFMFAVGAYWIFERDRAIALVQSLVPQRHRRVTRDTWLLIDQKLGGFVRGELLLIAFVAAVLSFAFWLDGEPYWLLLGVTAGIFEIVPVIGPLVVGVLAIGVGFTASWGTALGAGIAVIALRQLEDLFVAPRVLGHAVGLSPLVVLVSVTAIGILFGGFYVLLAIPIAAVLSTLVDVVLRGTDPAEEDVPPLLFPAKDVEAR